MSTLFTRIISAVVLSYTLCASITAQAASSVLVWPVYQIIESDQNGSALWLENRGAEPVSLQVRVLAWKQENFNERYADQNNVVASPPFATVPPGQRQLIRLIRNTPVPANTEQAYRIIVDEIPSPINGAAGGKVRRWSGCSYRCAICCRCLWMVAAYGPTNVAISNVMPPRRRAQYCNGTRSMTAGKPICRCVIAALCMRG